MWCSLGPFVHAAGQLTGSLRLASQFLLFLGVFSQSVLPKIQEVLLRAYRSELLCVYGTVTWINARYSSGLLIGSRFRIFAGHLRDLT